MRKEAIWPVALAALAVLIGGCGGHADLHPVTGQVLLDEKPVQGCMVILQPAGQVDPAATNPSGTTDAEGKFTISTYPEGDGARPGDYVACVIAPPGAEVSSGGVRVSALPNKYASRETSGLAVKVQPGKNELAPFRLKK